MPSNNTYPLSSKLEPYKSIKENSIKQATWLDNNEYSAHVKKRSPINLYYAAAQGDLESVKYFIENQGQNINLEDNLNQTLLHKAVFNGHLPVVEYLIRNGADLDIKNQLNLDFLDSVALNGHFSVIKFLEEKNVPIGNLFKAAEKGYLGIVKYLVENKAQSVNSKDSSDQTPLHQAAFNGHLNIVKYLVDNGADLNVKNTAGKTPLHYAAAQGDLESVKYFIENQSQNPNLKDNLGQTPLHQAIFNGRLTVVEYLVRNDADLEIKNQLDLNFLNRVALNAHFSVITYLVDVKNINIGNLFQAAEKNYLGIVKYFIEGKGEDINAKDDLSQTPLYAAAYNGHLHIVKYTM